MPLKHLPRQTVEHGQYEWVYLTRNLPQDIDYLRRNFDYHPIDLHETLPPMQRHKLVFRDRYLFMILLYPIFDRKSRIVSSAELDFFIEPNRIVTVSNGPFPVIDRFFESLKQSTTDRTNAFSSGIPQLLYSILEAQIESLFPMLIHLSQDIDNIEKDLFKANQRGVIMEVLRIKTNIVNVRKAMQGHRRVIQALIDGDHPMLLLNRKDKEYFHALIEQTKEIWDTVELQQDTINALHETHASLLENRTNDVIKTLTMFSVVVFPMTLVAAIFAMDVADLPFRNDPYGFLKIMAILAAIALGMFAYFKRKRWVQ